LGELKVPVFRDRTLAAVMVARSSGPAAEGVTGGNGDLQGDPLELMGDNAMDLGPDKLILRSPSRG
jgi:hypothetical protein